MSGAADSCEFPASLRWLDRPPLAVDSGLGGHVVIVLYWRLGCQHSRDALLDLSQTAAAFAGRAVAFICCHVPTTAAERDEQRLRRVLSLLPWPPTAAVTADRAWLREQQLSALPALVVLDDRGAVRFRGNGAPQRARLRAAIEALLSDAGKAGRLAGVPVAPVAPAASPPALVPTALAADGERLWLASAGQRRIFALDKAGTVTQTIGTGTWGGDDGARERASFALPTAMVIHDEYLVVADGGTHTVRAIDRERGEVTTWCGNGRRGGDLIGGGYGRDQALSSPGGLLSRDGGLYVSMTGTHQLWQVDPMTGAAMAWFGTGERAGPGDDDRLSEPTALCADDQTLWVAEAGRGEVAAIDLAHVQRRTLVSGLQRPTAMLVHGDRLLVADASGAAVSMVDPGDGSVEPWFSAADGLVEPVALATVGDLLYVADVGADQVFVANLASSARELRPLPLVGLGPAPPGRISDSARLADRLVLREHSDVRLRVPVPSGDAAIAAWSVDVVDEAGVTLACARHAVADVADGVVEVLLPVAGVGEGAWRVRLVHDNQLARYVVPVLVTVDGAMQATLSARS